MNRTIRTAWAIALDNGHFIGVYWFLPTGPPECVDGQHTCLWTTRLLARAALRKVKGPAAFGKHPSARVCRVVVRIAEAAAPRQAGGAE